MRNPTPGALRPLLVSLIVVLALVAAACGDDSDNADSSSGGQSHTDMTPAELEEWQTDLNAVGCWAGPVDGALGPQTEAAIKDYQTAEGLTVDGLLGPDTEGALQKSVADGDTVCTSDPTPDDLETWQTDLNAVGCWAGPVDGEDGPQTEAAIKEYQSAKGLTVDGLLGPVTEAALAADAAAGTTVCTGSTTTTSPADSTCPGGADCYQTSISPTSGGYGTTVTVEIVEGGCGDAAFLVPPGGGEPIAQTGTLEPAAGSLSGTLTIPDEIPAPETYTITTSAGPQDQCSKAFNVTAS